MHFAQLYEVSITFFRLFHCVSVYNYSWICVNLKTKHLDHFCVNKNHYKSLFVVLFLQILNLNDI